MEATLERPSLWSRPQGIVLAILGIVVMWCRGPLAPTAMALLAVVVFFLFGLRRPVWAMAALLVSELTVTSYMVNIPFGLAISLRLLLTLLIGLLVWRSLRPIDLGKKLRPVLVPASVLLGISLVANLANSGFDTAFRDARSMIVGLLIVILLPAVTSNLKDLKILCGVALVGLTGSAIVGVIQHYQWLGMGQATLIPGFTEVIAEGKAGVPGFSETQLELSYVLSTGLLTVLGICLCGDVGDRPRRLLLLSATAMAASLYFTYTRSSLYAAVMGLIALILFLKTRIRGGIILTVFLLAIALTEIFGLRPNDMFLGGRSEDIQLESAISRPILWQAGIAIAISNPILGIGVDRFETVSPAYVGSVDPSLVEWEEDRYYSYRTLGNQPPHNDFLNVWVSYGTLALVAYIWLYAAVLRNLLDSYRRSKRRLIKGLAVGLASALIAYGVNAFYHNMMMTLPLLWILAGFSVATGKLAFAERETEASSKAS